MHHGLRWSRGTFPQIAEVLEVPEERAKMRTRTHTRKRRIATWRIQTHKHQKKGGGQVAKRARTPPIVCASQGGGISAGCANLYRQDGKEGRVKRERALRPANPAQPWATVADSAHGHWSVSGGSIPQRFGNEGRVTAGISGRPRRRWATVPNRARSLSVPPDLWKGGAAPLLCGTTTTLVRAVGDGAHSFARRGRLRVSSPSRLRRVRRETTPAGDSTPALPKTLFRCSLSRLATATERQFRTKGSRMWLPLRSRLRLQTQC